MMQTKRYNHMQSFKSIAIGLALAAVLASGASCGGDAQSEVDTSLDTPTTRIRTLGKMQAVFDLMPKSAHDDMMDMMGGPESISHGEGGGHDHHGDSHFVMLTLMDVADRGATITDAQVSFIVNGPNGKSLAEGGHVMSGKGMHHYAVGFAGGEAGVYKVDTRIERGGESYTQAVEFELPVN